MVTASLNVKRSPPLSEADIPSSSPAPQLPAPTISINRDGTISASMPMDQASMDNMCYILELPEYLKELILNPPNNPMDVYRMGNEISDTLVWFFGLSLDLTRLERVVLPPKFLDDTGAVFQKLSELPRLKSLTLTMSTSLDYASPLVQRRLGNAIEQGIESLSHLEELVIPAAMVTGTLVDLLGRLFNSSVASYDGTTVYYYNPGRYSVLYEIPFILLPIA